MLNMPGEKRRPLPPQPPSAIFAFSATGPRQQPRCGGRFRFVG